MEHKQRANGFMVVSCVNEWKTRNPVREERKNDGGDVPQPGQNYLTGCVYRGKRLD